MTNRIFCDVCATEDQALYDSYDLYTLAEQRFNSNDIMDQMLSQIAKIMGLQAYHRACIPCQHLPNPGVSGVILASGFHFTCHTFSKQCTAYVDTFGLRDVVDDRTKITELITSCYQPDMIVTRSLSFNFAGNFGRHLIFTVPYVPFEEMMTTIEQLVQGITMHKLAPVMVNYTSPDSYDILQPIVESHIAAHAQGGTVEVDVFSCRDFEEYKVFKYFSECSNIHLIPRGAPE